MRVLLIGLFLLGGCGTVDALEKARTPSEAYYLIKKKKGDKSVNPYDNDPKYAPVYCTVDGVEFRTTAADCENSKGIAIPTS
jgi:hypothetical protein